jgi:DNA polymerase-3 subunit beta
MEIKIDRNALLEALTLTAGALSTRSTHPILTCYELVTDGDSLRVTAFSYDISVRIWVEAVIHAEGAIALPGKILREYIATQPQETLTIEVNPKRLEATIASLNSKATLKGLAVEDFPLFTEPTGHALPLLVTDFLSMIPSVALCASSDESKPTLCGIHFVLKDDAIQLAATDGYRLAVRKLKTPIKEQGEMIVPAEQLSKLDKLLAKADGEVLLYKDDNRVWFALTGKAPLRKMIGCIGRVDARFPDYWAIVPKTTNTRVKLDTADFLKALRVARLFARENAQIVRLYCKPDGRVEVCAISSESGDTNSTLTAEVKGETVEIAFNVTFIIAMLEVIGYPKVVLELTQPTRPGILYPDGMEKSDFMYVIMPMSPPK